MIFFAIHQTRRAGFFYGKNMATQPTQNEVPSESPRDLKFNAGKIDEFVTSNQQHYVDRLGNEHRTIAGINKDADRAMKAYGYITKKSFEMGATLDTPNTVLQWESNGEYYRWDGDWSKPKDVPAGSTPDSAGGIGAGKWVGVGDASLRSDLTSDNGGDDIVSSLFGGDIKDAYISRQRLPGNGVHLFIVYGQSNAKGTAQNTTGAPDFVSPYARYWNGSALVPMTSYMKTSNDGTSTGSAWLAFANKYVGLSGRRTVFINSGKDSQSIAQLQKGDASNNYTNMLAYVNAAKSAITNEGLNIDKISVLFIQGERDQVLNTGKSAYKSAMSTLWSNLKADTGATSFFNYTIGTYNNDTNPKRAFVIQSAQREFCEENTDAYIASEDVPKVKAAGMSVDAVHLSQLGYNVVGENSAVVVDGILNGNKGRIGAPSLDRRGCLSLSSQQEWMMHGAWINKVNGSWNLDPSLSRAVSLITSVTDEGGDYLTVTIPTDLSYLLATGGGSFYTTGSSDLKVIFDRNMYQDRTAEGLTLVKVYFLTNVQVLVNTTTQAFQTNPRTNLSMGNTVTASNWGTGSVTLAHPLTKSIPIIQNITSGVFFHGIDETVSNNFTTRVTTINAAAAAVHSKFAVNLLDCVVPPRALPDGTELFFNITGARKTVL